MGRRPSFQFGSSGLRIKNNLPMDTWDHFENWSLVLPPSRPSADQIASVRQILASIDTSLAVAILGSTPEFRDLVFEAGFRKVVVFDKNKKFHSIATDMRVHRSQETLEFGDWVERLPDFEDTFGLILSDLTSGNVPYSQRSVFYQAITNALAPGGIFIDKILTHPCPHLSVEALFTKYDMMPLNLLSVNTFSSEMLFCSTLLDRRNLVDTSLFYQILDAEAPTARLRAFSRQARYITPENGIWYYGMPWAQLQSSYCPTLLSAEICKEGPTSPYFGRVKHFALRKER